MKDESHCSSVPPYSSKVPPNAFRPDYLQKLADREDGPTAALEAELRGPWKVVKLPVAAGGGGGDGGNGDGGDGGVDDFDAERWVVLRSFEKPEEADPMGTFRFREYALLWAAALELTSRGSELGVGISRDEDGQVVVEWLRQQGPRTIGHAAVWDENLPPTLHVLDALLRVPEALARVVDAGGAPIVELLGRRLMTEEE
jgi:hypothetical protein